jgi:hypothetical protein
MGLGYGAYFGGFLFMWLLEGWIGRFDELAVAWCEIRGVVLHIQ